MSTGEFSVFQFFVDDSERVVDHVGYALAEHRANLLTKGVDGPRGAPDRVIVTDDRDNTWFEWKPGERIKTYYHPPPEGPPRPMNLIGLSTRVKNCLMNSNLRGPEEVSKYTRDELLHIPNLGPASIDEIEQWLSGLGLVLAVPPGFVKKEPPPRCADCAGKIAIWWSYCANCGKHLKDERGLAGRVSP